MANSNSLSITGKFLGAGQIKTVGQNNRQIRNFWVDITDNPDYPNTPEFQLFGDKVYYTDNIQKGQTIEVKFNLNGRKYENQQTGKKGVITNLDCWQINLIQMQSAAARPAPVQQAAPVRTQPNQARPVAAMQPVGAGFANLNDDENDLPF